ncbi:hypothetical protein C2G38_2165585 [Gigaspora rosea]|uniref:Uncharacterized protein n=1 Tax=Gigaspora rosea TaxID=44941 RepID=A0A397VZY1_9GLOM|nr:hypothetical protein C2G38_2165585 [Gigaspora rosea]
MSLNPENNPFTIKQNHTNYKYHIINEGFYPPQNKIHYTLATSRSGDKYKIPEGYLVQTSWERSKSHHMLECEIEYEQDRPVFIIRFEENLQQYVLKSKKSPTKVANDYLQVILKFFNSLDKPDLQEIKFNIQDKNYVIDYNKYDKKNNDRSLDPFLEVIDRGPISHHAYHKLAAIQPELPRAYEISNTGKRINQEISTNIPIFTLNIENMSLETSNVNEGGIKMGPSLKCPFGTSLEDNQEVEEEVLKYIRKACYRRITDILLYILPGLVDQNVLNANNPVINI